MRLFRFSRKPLRTSAPRARLDVEPLEGRLVPYTVSANAWPHPELVTLSFVPDGTNLGGVTSNLQSTFDNHASAAFRSGWRKEVLRAAQVWAQQTNLNFALVTDSGAASGSGAYQQGDPTFGDIRVGAYTSGGNHLGSAIMPPPVNNYSIAGDFTLNSSPNWVINQAGGYDLFTVAAHEIGHSLGLYHSTVQAAEEYAFYNAIKPSLRTDDIAGIRAIYSAGLGRSPDLYDAVLSNGSFLAATNLTALVNPVTKTALVQNLDLTTLGDHDYYSVVAPAGTSSTLKVNVQSSGLSMLMPTVTVYNALQQQVGYASGAGQYGSTLSVNVSGVAAGQLLYVKVSPAETTAFGTGRYALTLNFGTGASPTVPLPDTRTATGSPIQGGGGTALREGAEFRVNATTLKEQQDAAVAMDAAGNYVVAWASKDQDGDTWGVYAQRFTTTGSSLGSEFRVNTGTSKEQMDPAVAMDADGDFVVAWVSLGQDGDSWGVYAQRFDALGVRRGTEFRVNTGTSKEQVDPAVAMDAAGNFVVTWASLGQDGDSWGVYAQRYNAAGQLLGGEFRVNTRTAQEQTDPAVAADAAGNFVVVWTSNGQDGAAGGVYAQRYSAAGAAQGGEFRVNTTTAKDQQSPVIAVDADGDFVVTWASLDQDGDGWGVYAQRFDSLGARRGGEFRAHDGNSKDQISPSVGMEAGGAFVVTWTTLGTTAEAKGVYAQQFDAAGTARGNEVRVNTTNSGDQHHSAAAADGSGGFVVVWGGEGPGDDQGIFGQRYQLQGGGGVAEAPGDLLAVANHEHGCGCSCPVCQAAAGATDSDPAPTGAPDVAGLLAGGTRQASGYAAVTPAVPAPAPDTRSTDPPDGPASNPADPMPHVTNPAVQARDALFTNLDRLADVLRLCC